MELSSVHRQNLKKNLIRFGISTAITAVLIIFCVITAHAAPGITVDVTSGTDSGGSFGVLELLFLFVVIALAPSILLMMTSFTRIIIVLSFLRSALGTQQTPPNQILIGLALFLTLFIMQPVFSEINEQAYQPYNEGVISQEVAVERAIKPMKVFMIKQIDPKSLNLFLSISGRDDLEGQIDATNLDSLTSLGLEIIVPSFITSELKRAFIMVFYLFLPFLIIDMVVSSTLMSMGMVMLPPSMIALPFKIMMFVLVDGWGMLFDSLIRSFGGFG